MRHGIRSPEHQAKLRASGTQPRVFTEAEQQFIREAYPDWRKWSLGAMAAELRCAVRNLKREARRLGLPPRREQKAPTKASDLTTKRKNNKAARFDPEPERSSPEPTCILYACPGCGTRAASPLGHAQCLKQEVAA